MSRVKIALVNESTVLDDADVAHYAEAYQKQVVNDLRHHWLVDALVYFSPKGKAIAPTTWQIHFADTLDVANALGYHDLTTADVPLSLIGAQLDLDGGYSPSITGSHEICEMLVDPYLTQATQVGSKAFIATETCDPCEADEYGYAIHTKDGTAVDVSDFITPHWFQMKSPGPWDFCGHMTEPLTLLPGGYALYWTPTKGWQQMFAKAEDNAAATKGVAVSGRARSSLRSWGRAALERNEDNPYLEV